MASLDERVAYLEGRTDDHTGAMTELRGDVRELRVELRDVRSEIRDVRDQMNRGFQSLGGKIDRHFIWVVGIQMAMLVAMLGALLRR